MTFLTFPAYSFEINWAQGFVISDIFLRASFGFRPFPWQWRVFILVNSVFTFPFSHPFFFFFFPPQISINISSASHTITWGLEPLFNADPDLAAWEWGPRLGVLKQLQAGLTPEEQENRGSGTCFSSDLRAPCIQVSSTKRTHPLC